MEISPDTLTCSFGKSRTKSVDSFPATGGAKGQELSNEAMSSPFMLIFSAPGLPRRLVVDCKDMRCSPFSILILAAMCLSK